MLKKRWRFKKMKRQNGEGTWGTKKIKGILYKRYSVSYPEGRKDFYGKTKKEIDQKVQAYNKKRSPYVRPCTDSNLITFGQYSLDYIHTIAAQSVSPRTLGDYENIIICRVIPKSCILGELQLKQITPQVLNNYIKYLTFEKKYSHETIVKTIRVVKHVLQHGIKEGRIALTKEDLADFKAPSQNAVLTPKREIPYLAEEDIEKLYIEAQKPKYTSSGWSIILILYTGLRIGELQELRWKDIDLKKKTLTVTRAVTRVKTGSEEYGNKYTYMIKPTPKTLAGKRIIPLCNRAQEALTYFSRLNPEHTSEDLVCIVDKHHPKMKNRDNLRRSLNYMLVNANCSVKHCGLHALRHSFGSYLLASGIDIKVVSILMGHKDVSTTYNYYIHISNQQLIEATTIFDHL